MIVYHGTTHRRAERICEGGFLPRKPSRKVWFAESRKYAEGRAKTQARRSHDRAVVLACELDLSAFRRRLGPKRVLHRGRVIAIDGPVTVDVIRSHPLADYPTSPDDLAQWINRILRLRPWKGVSRKHPGILRLSRWITNHLLTHKRGRYPTGELLGMARQWLPEFFDGVEVDEARLVAVRRPSRIQLVCKTPDALSHLKPGAAIALLDSDDPAHRRKGLKLLADLHDGDLADWCDMYLGDDNEEVALTALRLLRRCDDVNREKLIDMIDDPRKRVRANALATLARRGGAEGAEHWFDRGLKDPEPCVRLEMARLLDDLDPGEHRRLFTIALCDPNPDVAKRARRLTHGKGFRTPVWNKTAARQPGRGVAR